MNRPDKKVISGGNRRERKKEETTLNIIGAAMKLFRKQGFEFTTMEQIADEADIAKGTLYNHFTVKEEIVCAYWQNSVRELIPYVEALIKRLPDTRTRLNALFEKSADWFRSHRDLAKIYVRYRFLYTNDRSRYNKQRSGFQDVVSMVVAEGQNSGELRNDINLTELTGYLYLMYGAVLAAWLDKPGSTAKPGFEQVIDLFLTGSRLQP